MPTKMVSFNIAKSQIDRQDPHQNLVGGQVSKEKERGASIGTPF